MSAREQLLSAVDTILGAIDGVEEYEAEAIADPGAFPALASYDQGQREIEREAGSTRYELSFRVEGYVEGGSGVSARAELNGLHARTVKALTSDPTLGGLAELIEETGELRRDIAELASKRRQGFAQDFIIQYSTPRGDPTVLS
jgi:hypothetical protein